jgi:carotenoid cleavage dioxygenase-like enzyme
MFSNVLRLFTLLLLNTTTLCFINIKFGHPFKISHQEINKSILYKIEKDEQKVVKKIRGFYGLIGPEINMTNVGSLYDLFTGDGNIQGVFFDEGKITFTKYFIRTDKLLYEEKNGRMPRSFFSTLVFSILDLVNVLPNILGLANTAILNVEDNLYSLFERDNPYLLDVDFKNKVIDTVQKIKLNEIHHFSGHSKYNKENKIISTLDCNIESNAVSYYNLNNTFGRINKTVVNMEYLPLVHDYINVNKLVIFVDSPIEFDFTSLMKKKIPVNFSKEKKTNVIVINNETFEQYKIKTNESFFIFHYAKFNENSSHIELFAPIYENIDFSKLDINGKYRKMIIDKVTNEISFEKNEELEQYNLDFPKMYERYVILRNIENYSINGFIICNELNIIKKIFFKDRSIAGEPEIINIENVPHLLTFAYDSNQDGYLMIINIITEKTIEIPLYEKISIGFHSIFYNA